MTIGGLHLMRPEWLWALLPCAVLFIALWYSRKRAGSWSSVIAPELLQHLVGEQAAIRQRNYLPWILIAWLLAVVALVGPSVSKIQQPVHQREAALLLVLDLSYSMKAADVAPSRIDRARQNIIDLLQERDEGQTGLIAFAGDAHVVSPLTDDHPTIINLLPALNPDMMPVPGSDAQSAIELALELLKSAGIIGGRIVLLSDGVSASQTSAIAEAVQDAGAELIVMGVGTANGAPLPLPGGGFVKDSQGAIVMPGLDSESLTKLARRAGGRYLPLELAMNPEDLAALANNELLPGQERLTSSSRRADHWQDQGYFLVLLLLPLVLVLFRRGLLFTLVPLFFVLEPHSAQAQSWDSLWLTADQQGVRALEQGELERAQQLFDNPAWAGTAAYQNGDYEAAVENFSSGDSADDWYNRGNALARSGQLDQAIEAYRQSLAIKPDQADAQNNIELLEQLKQQQEQQEQQDSSSEDADNQDQQQNQDQGQDQEQSQGDQDSQDAQQNNEPSEQQASKQHEPQDSAQQPAQDQDQDSEQSDEADKANQEPEEQAQQQDAEARSQQEQAQASPEQAERDQAMEQWLRRVPDDPSGLLREKFRYESRQRQQQGIKPNNESYW